MPTNTELITAIGTAVGAVGTVGAVIVALYFSGAEARRRHREEHRRQAECIAAWFVIEHNSEERGFVYCTVTNSSDQLVYDLVISLVSVHGAYRKTAVGVDRNGPIGGCQTYVGGAFPPGSRTLPLGYPGSALQVRYGVELAFRDVGSRYWIRGGDGRLREVATEPLVLYGSGPPGPGPGTVEIHGAPGGRQFDYAKEQIDPHHLRS